MSSAYDPEGSAGKRSCPFSFVVTVEGPPISAGEVTRTTAPEMTPQGIQMFALCEKKESKSDSPAKSEARQQIFSKKFEAESKRYLDEIRKQAMIEYKGSKDK